VPGFPVLSLPVGASNDVCSRTIALHSAPWQMVGHSDELASGDTGTEGQGGAFYIISQGPPKKSLTMHLFVIFCHFATRDGSSFLISWFMGLLISGCPEACLDLNTFFVLVF